MAAWRYEISPQVMKFRISARSCIILYLYLHFLAVDLWCVKRIEVGFSEVSLRGVMKSAKPITTAYHGLVSASTSLG